MGASSDPTTHRCMLIRYPAGTMVPPRQKMSLA